MMFSRSLLAIFLSCLSAQATAEENAYAPNNFQDCPDCPQMTVIPAGSFLMGSPDTEAGRDRDEGPRHRVTFSNGFAIGIFEVTFDQWDACHAAGGCDHDPGDVGWGRSGNPVIHVSWSDARQYAAWLTNKTGRDYRLPTEAEWEYAARAGSSTIFHHGNSLSPAQATIDPARGYPPNPDPDQYLNPFRRRAAIRVGQDMANAFGLHNIHGNVSEWVQDCYAPDAYRTHEDYPAAVDMEGQQCRRTARGGTSHYSGAFARSANRADFDPGLRSLDIGFRLAAELEGSAD